MRHCLIFNSLCVALAVLAVCVVLIEPQARPESSRRRKIALCVFVNETSLSALNLLNLAFYPRHTVVNLYVVSPLPGPTPIWVHGQYKRVPCLPRYDGSDCVILLDDSMEVSPIFVFWFIRACRNRSVVSGGEAGLALSAKTWQRFADEIGCQDAISAVAGFISRHNLTAEAPGLKGYTFVRSQRQNPILPEHEPKLARGMRAGFFVLD